MAKIIYVGSETGDATYTHGLALALADEQLNKSWSAAGTTCSSMNTSSAVTGASWMLASQAQWNTMISAAGTHTDLRNGFSGPVAMTHSIRPPLFAPTAWTQKSL